MKDGRYSVALNLNLLNEKTSFEKFEENLKISIFGVLYILLKNQSFSIWAEIIFVLLQLLQFMAFAFRPIFSNIWKDLAAYTNVSNFLQYFQIVMFFDNNSSLYIIAFYVCIILIILVIINIVYVAVSFAKNKFNVIWPLKMLRAVLSFIVNVLFLPILELFISIFDCVDPSTVRTNSARLLTTSTVTASVTKVNALAPSITCWQGAYLLYVVLSVLLSIALIVICVVVQLTYFETKSSTQNQTAKSSSKSDVFMLVCKIICVLLFGFVGTVSNQWVLIIILFFLALSMFISYHDERPYYSDKLMKTYLICTGIFLWNVTVLLIGKILETSKFNGCVPLFFLGLPIVLAIILTNYENRLAILMTTINKFQKGENVIKQINYFLDLIDKREFDRNTKVVLKGYIFLYEESCLLKDCALKKYLYAVEQNLDTVACLLQHTELLYQTGISRFPSCTPLRVAYSFFLLERMNKKQQAIVELLNTEKYSPRFEEQFIIYRYQKIIEEQSSELSESDDNLDLVSNIAYKNHFVKFKSCITKVATLYIDFWSLLLNQDNNEDLTKLNDYGSRINLLVEEINEHFEKMQKLKQNDADVIKYYSDFLNDILNDKEKAMTYKSKLSEVEGTKQKYDEANLVNIDLNALQSSDEYQYVIISATPEKFGFVINVSLGICTIFGYSRADVVGKNVEFIMPEIFHASHRRLLLMKINEYRKITMSVQNSRNFKPTFHDVISVGKNKSRYLVPFCFKVTFVPNNEQSDSVFLAKVSQDVNKIGNTDQNQQVCHILTNNAFIIQNFTANSINVLGMNSNAINNGNMEITRFIKEFQEEFSKYQADLEDKTPEQIILIKRHILMNKFKNGAHIVWNRSEEMTKKNKQMLDNDKDSHGNKHFREGKIIKDNKFLFDNQKNSASDNLTLSITEVIIAGSREGYVFKFDLVNEKRNSLEFNSAGNKSLQKDRGSRSSLKKLNVMQEIEKLDLKNPIDSISVADFKIDKSFVPDTNWNFQIDPKKMSFLVNPKNLQELRDIVKDEALKKLRLVNEPSVIESSDSEYSSSDESGSRDENYEKESYRAKEKEIKRKQNDNYYRIDFENIKYLTYDTKRDALIEVAEWSKETQIESKLRSPNEIYKSEGDDEKNDPEKTNKENADAAEDEAVDQGKEGILVKQIEYALSKEETQPTITRMKWISFFVFVFYIGFASLFLAMFLNSMAWMIENITLIYQSYDLIENTIYGIFHTRELVLLNNPKYTNTYQPLNNYIKNNTDVLLNLFASSHDLLTNLITTFISFTPADETILLNKTIYTTILQDDLNIKQFNLTLASGFIETNTALYHIAHMSITDIIATNKDVFFYMYNSLNDISMELYNRALIYVDEFGYNVSSFQMMFLYIFLGTIIFAVIAYFIVTYAYVEVEKRKESYLEVFFEIGGNVIKNSLEKCENFSKKLQTDSMSDSVSNLDEAELNGDISVHPVSNTIKKEKVGRKRRNNSTKEAKEIKIKLGFGMSFFSLFFFLLYFMYQNYLNTIQIYSQIFQNTCLEQTQYLSLFNSLREYFYDVNNQVNYNVVGQSINLDLNKIYSFKLSQNRNLTIYQNYFPTDYATLYTSIINNNICSYSTDFFSTYLGNAVDCTKFVSNSSSYGLTILLTNYVEEMRYAKYKFDLLLRNSASSNFSVDNNTLYGLLYNDNGYNQNDPFQIFNDPSHMNLVILTRYLLRPAYSALKLQLKTSIDSSMATFQTLYIVIFSIFLTWVFGTYLFIWRPFEDGLNQTIYKTKNMLQIIPKEVLASLSNIHKLLDIGQNLNKSKRRMKS